MNTIVKNVTEMLMGPGALSKLAEHLPGGEGAVAFLVDDFFRDRAGLVGDLPVRDNKDRLIFVDTGHEPTTEGVDEIVAELQGVSGDFKCVVGIGGGSTMDTAKAVSNLLANGGRAEDYQGWDLVKLPGVFKIGVPTISGTGAESSRTCVMMNQRKNLKLGMNSHYTIFDRLILDPDLTVTVPRDQYFYTGMDTYIHCVESLEGRHRNVFADAYSHEALRLCREVFLEEEDMMAPAAREKLMAASYLGGAALANSLVGLVHPLSAGLSMVYGSRHCVSNCIVMQKMQSYYPAATEEFLRMADRQGVSIPSGVCEGADESQWQALYASSIIHEKPLLNAMGPEFRNILTEERVREIYASL